MKKLSLIIAMLMGFTLVSNSYADDLSELEELLNSETEITTSGSDENATVDVDESIQPMANTETSEKLTLSVTGDVKSDAVSLTFKKLPEYSEYKVYYSKTSETELSEKSVSANELDEEVVVDVTGLDANTQYQFVVKAFDNDGNPIAATESDSLDVQTIEKVEASNSTETTEQKEDTSHPAANDNVIYNPVITTSDNKIHISYKLGSDVKKVQISISDDAKTFKPVVTLGNDVTSYTINTTEPGRKYLKLVPIDGEGELGICKIGKTNLKENIIPVEHKEIGKPKTGPEMYLLILLAIATYVAYAIRKNRA